VEMNTVAEGANPANRYKNAFVMNETALVSE